MAACADSCITSPSLPVTVSLPLPSIRVHSVVRIWPPTSVHASPVAAPISFFFSVVRSRNFHGPSRSGTLAPLITLADLAVLAALIVHHLARDLAADVADLALQVADARFAGVVLDQPVSARHR